MNNSIGFLSIHISEDDKSRYITNKINQIASIYNGDVILFNSKYDKTDKDINKFGVLHINEARFFKGPIIAFDLKNLILLKNCLVSKKKFLYMMDPEWIQFSSNIGYTQLKELYNNSCDEILTFNFKLKELVDICWKEATFLEENNNEEFLRKIIN